MKKITVLLLCAALLVGAGAAMIAVPLTMKYAVTQYTRELGEHMADYMAGGRVTAEYGGVTTGLSPENLSYLSSALSRSTMRRVFSTPGYEPADAARIEFSDGAVYLVFDATPEGEDSDRAYIIYTYGGKTRTFRVEEMETMERVTDCISPQGLSKPNQVLN